MKRFSDEKNGGKKMDASNNVANEEEYHEYGDCNTCIHKNEICTNCMSQNTAGEWVHNLYSPKPGVYRMPGQRTITCESKTVGGICLGMYIVS